MMDIPSAWEDLDLERMAGVCLVVGGVDTGKTTFAHYLFQRQQEAGLRVAYVDGDPGQSSLGPPTTLTLAFDINDNDSANRRRYFVGATTPRGHMLPALVGAGRLVSAAQAGGADVTVYDTSGLIDASQGGLAFKLAKIDLLRPQLVIGIQRKDELEPLLLPLRRSRRARVLTLRPSPSVQRRDVNVRRANRRHRFTQHFQGAGPQVFEWTRVAVFPYPRFSLNRLVALEDAAGFTLGLGIVTEIDRERGRVVLLTPVAAAGEVRALRIGSILVDPVTFQDEQP